MKAIALGMCASFLALAAHAETPRPAALSVGLRGIDLQTEEGVAALSHRFLRKMWSICGRPNDFALSYINTGGGKKERAACRDELRIAPGHSEPVKRAFNAALLKFG